MFSSLPALLKQFGARHIIGPKYSPDSRPPMSPTNNHAAVHIPSHRYYRLLLGLFSSPNFVRIRSYSSSATPIDHLSQWFPIGGGAMNDGEIMKIYFLKQ